MFRFFSHKRLKQWRGNSFCLARVCNGSTHSYLHMLEKSTTQAEANSFYCLICELAWVCLAFDSQSARWPVTVIRLTLATLELESSQLPPGALQDCGQIALAGSCHSRPPCLFSCRLMLTQGAVGLRNRLCLESNTSSPRSSFLPLKDRKTQPLPSYSCVFVRVCVCVCARVSVCVHIHKYMVFVCHLM